MLNPITATRIDTHTCVKIGKALAANIETQESNGVKKKVTKESKIVIFMQSCKVTGQRMVTNFLEHN